MMNTSGSKNKLAVGITNVERFLHRHFEFRNNIVSNQIEYKALGGKVFKPLNVNTVYRSLQHHNLVFSYQQLDSLLKSDFVTDYDPFLEYFKSLPDWDGSRDYIDEFASYVKADDQKYFNSMLKKMLVRVIACALHFIPNRTVFVLFGKQEMGKSWWIRYLSPWGINQYYTEANLRNDKDTNMRFAENLIYNLEELADLTNFEVGRLKAIISAAMVKERKPYDRNEIAMPRRCSFFGSSNKTEFLNDTESTRWLILKVLGIDHSYRGKVNIDNVWAQAYSLYKRGFDYNLTEEEKKTREVVNKEYEVTYAEYEAVAKNFSPDGTEFWTRQQIIDRLHSKCTIVLNGGFGESLNPLKFQPHLITKALATLGFKNARKYIGRNQVRGYYLRELIDPRLKDDAEDTPTDSLSVRKKRKKLRKKGDSDDPSENNVNSTENTTKLKKDDDYKDL